jgi:hypothetical protein
MSHALPQTPEFITVAEEGEKCIAHGEPLRLPLGPITDPELAFGTAFFTWVLWDAIKEERYQTFIKLLAPQFLQDKIFEVQAMPMSPAEQVLAEAHALVQRIERKQVLTYLGKTYDTTGVTLRVTIYHTSFDVRSDSDINSLLQKWLLLDKQTVPTFGNTSSGVTVVGAERTLITS